MPEKTDTAGGYYSEDPLKLCGGNGEGEPVFDPNGIIFNGDDSIDLAHETFAVYPKPFNDFCKTARKPYDLMVCAVLLSMKRHMINFSFTSDGRGTVGETDDWKPAKDFYQKVCGKK